MLWTIIRIYVYVDVMMLYDSYIVNYITVIVTVVIVKLTIL